jgi:hypothetical protein
MYCTFQNKDFHAYERNFVACLNKIIYSQDYFDFFELCNLHVCITKGLQLFKENRFIQKWLSNINR